MNRVIYTSRTLLFLCACFIGFATTPSSAMAQQGEPYCDALSTVECALVANSVSAMSEISSGATESTIEMVIQDIPEMPASDMAFRYDQSIGFSLGEDVAALFRELQGMTQAEIEMIGDDPTRALAMARTLVNDMNLGLDIDFEMSAGMALLLSDLLRSEIGMDLPPELSLRLMIVDGLFYIDTASIAPFAPEITAFVDGWVGADANPLLDMAAAELAGVDGSASSAAADSGTEMMPGTIGLTGALVATVDAFDPSGEIAKFLDVEIVEADSASEDNVYFHTSVNYADFFSSPIFEQLVVLFANDQGAPTSDEELQELLTVAQIMGPSLLQGLELQMVESIQPSTGYVTSGDLLLEWDLRSLLTLAAQGDPTIQIGPESEPFVGLSAVSSTMQINEDVELVPPAGAFVLPTEMLMGFME